MVQAMMGLLSWRPVIDWVYHSRRRFWSLIHFHWRVPSCHEKLHTRLVILPNALTVPGQMHTEPMPMLRCWQASCRAWSVNCIVDPRARLFMNCYAALVIPGRLY